MKTKSRFAYLLTYHAGILMFSFVSAVVIKFSQTGRMFAPETYLVAAILFVMIETIGQLAQYFKKKTENLPAALLRKKIVPGFLLFLFLIVLVANFTVSSGVFIWYVMHGMDLDNFFHNLIFTELSYANKSLIIWLLLFSVLFFFGLWQKTSKREDKLREENLVFRYKTLKSQVNPHFLFNSLNTLSELIYTDVHHADAYIRKLSGIYRYILDNEECDQISLEKEIAFIQDYVELQKYRDDGKISLTMDVTEPGRFGIVPVSLQVLVENAFKHNARSTDHPLNIHISLRDSWVVVSNNIHRKNSLESSTKTGLSNLKERVHLITGKNMIVSDEKGIFKVEIPLIAIQE